MLKKQYAVIKSKHKPYAEFWGFVVYKDERYHWITGGTFGSDCLPFGREEFVLPRRVPEFANIAFAREYVTLAQAHYQLSKVP